MSFSLSLTIKKILSDIFDIKNEKIDASRLEGTVPIETLPPAALERMTVVKDDAARFALTKEKVQNGDTVKVSDTKKMYFVNDDTKLDVEDGYEEYVTGGAASAAIADKAKLALNSEKLGGLTLENIRNEIKTYPANLQDQSIKNRHLAPDLKITADNIADNTITKNQLSLTAKDLDAYNRRESDEAIKRALAYVKNEINQSYRKIGTKVITGNTDWNTLTEPATYKIQGVVMDAAHHAPSNEYNFGLLVVNRLENGADDGWRTVQTYFPHSTRGYWSRMYNGPADYRAEGWLDWKYIPTHNEVETIAEQKANAKVSKLGDTMTGDLTALSIYANNWFRVNGENAGIHWQKYGGGWHMTDNIWIRTFGGKKVYCDNVIRADGGFEGNLRGTADNANVAQRVTNEYKNMRFYWNGQGGQPTWLWGSNDGENIYIWNPLNFTVNRANTAGVADFATRIRGNKLIFENGTELWIE